MQPEYYYNEILRWNFGFENPNMAAVLFACVLPLLWMAWMFCWRLKSRWIKIPSLLIASALVLADCFCLFKTYSRGGAVAAFLALAYLLFHIAWTRRPWQTFRLPSAPLYASAGLLAGILALFVWSGVGSRSVEAATDASAGNRLVLWRYALRMAAENPSGFGSGNSGEAYMQWYQPLDMTAGYRTMVNSYLTFLVEHGWPVFFITLFGFLAFWLWTSPGTPGAISSDLSAGLRASLLAFLVSGFFSTIMEEASLWILPGICVVLLAVQSVWLKRSISRSQLGWAMAVAVILGGLLYAGGFIDRWSDPLYRKFEQTDGGSAVVEVGVKGLPASERPWLLVPDASVLGQNPGKLLRQLALQTGSAVRISSESSIERDRRGVILVGDAVAAGGTFKEKPLILLAPAITQQSKADGFLSAGTPMLILLTDIDEDGRVSFWEERIDALRPGGVQVVRIEGVGTQVDWAWDQVVDAIKDL